MPSDQGRFTDAQAGRLISLYKQAEKEILSLLVRALLKGNSTAYLNASLDNIHAILKGLESGSRTWCQDAIPRIYTAGMDEANAQIKRAGGTVQGGFGAIHQQAAQVLAEAAFTRFMAENQTIGRRIDDIFRALALEDIKGTVLGFESWQQTARRFRTDLSEHGITAFVDKKGRRWNMGTYSRMVARTTSMEALLGGTTNRLLENGYDLVRISRHLTPCPKCSPWQGEVLSLTGQTEGYDTMDEARSNGLFHPNCRHAFGVYIPELSED